MKDYIQVTKVKKKIKNIISKVLDGIYHRTPDWMLGRQEDWNIKLYSQYGHSFSLEEAARRLGIERRKLLSGYLAVSLFGLLLTGVFLLTVDRAQLPGEIIRPQFEKEAYSLPLEVKLDVEGESFYEKINLSVKARMPEEKEKEERILRLAKELPERIKGNNASLNHVTEPLMLFTKDENTGAMMRWFSEKPERIKETGAVDLIGISEPEEVTLKAEIRLNDLVREVYIKIILFQAEEKQVIKSSISQRIRETVSALERDLGEPSIRLPTIMDNGIAAEWTLRRDGISAAAIPVMCLVLCLFLFQRRYCYVEKEMRDRKEAIKREFPELVSQVVLLLNAGMVVSAALFEIADTAEKGGRNSSPLFYEISRMAERVRSSNASFTKELMVFSQTSGIRELVRFSSIVADNVDKGSSLAEKLQREGELLRDQQKKMAEERGRLAETKLSFPLMLLLLIVILIAVSPVMFEV